MLTRAVSMEGESTFTAKTSLKKTLVNCASASMAKSGVPAKNALHYRITAAEGLPQIMVNVVRPLTVPKRREIRLKNKCHSKCHQVVVQLPKKVLAALMLGINQLHLSQMMWMVTPPRQPLRMQLLQIWHQGLMEFTLEMKMKSCLSQGPPHPLHKLYQKSQRSPVLLPRKLQEGQ